MEQYRTFLSSFKDFLFLLHSIGPSRVRTNNIKPPDGIGGFSSHMNKYKLKPEFYIATLSALLTGWATPHPQQVLGLFCLSSGHLGRIQQPCECCSVYNKMLFLQNSLKFSPTSGDLIQKCTSQQVPYASFLPFSPLLAQRSKTTYLVCFYPLSKLPRLIHL